MDGFPRYFHSWTQSDRYAISMGFLNNGFDLLHPRTYNLLPGLQTNSPENCQEGITAVDCPIHEFAIAGIMKATDNTSPQVFRWYTLIYGCVGLIFLALLVLETTNSYLLPLVLVLFAISTPVYMHYLNGFLPTIPSISNALIGYYFYFKFLREKRLKFIYLSIIFLTLAALARLPFSIFLIAVACQQTYGWVINKQYSRRQLIALVVGLGTAAGYSGYNQLLIQNYGTAFLFQLRPIDSWEVFIELWNEVQERWGAIYLSLHQLMFLGLVITGIIIGLVRNFWFGVRPILFQALIIFAGLTIYTVLIGLQFREHDYYFLDTWFLWVILVALAGIKCLSPSNWVAKEIMALACAIPLFFTPVAAKQRLSERQITGWWDRREMTRLNFQYTLDFVNQTIPKDAKLLVIDSYTSNVPLLFMKRYGYTVMNTKRENLVEALNWPYDYVVIQHEWMRTDVIDQYPEIVNKLKNIGTNGIISIFERRGNSQPQSLEDFYGLSSPIISKQSQFEDTTNVVNWTQVTNYTSEHPQSGTACGKIRENEFLFTIEFDPCKYNIDAEISVSFTGWFKQREKNKELHFVLTSSVDDELCTYKSTELSRYFNQIDKWQKIELVKNLSVANIQGEHIKAFIWNNEEKSFLVDNVKLSIY